MVVRVHSSPHISLICINTIENCRYLARAVYGKGRQFNSINELIECILFEWEKVNKKNQKIFLSMPRRVISIIRNSGDSTKISYQWFFMALSFLQINESRINTFISTWQKMIYTKRIYVFKSKFLWFLI